MSAGARHLLAAFLLFAPSVASARPGLPGLHLHRIDLSGCPVAALRADYYGPDGKFVAGASADRFSVLLHGEEHPIDEAIPFDESRQRLYLVIVPQLDGVDPAMRAREVEAIRRLAGAARGLPAKVAVIGMTRGAYYGQDLQSPVGFKPALPAADPGEEAAEPHLLDGVRAAISQLSSPTPDDARKLIVVLTDGRDPSIERRDFSAMGMKAVLANITIDTLKIPTGHAGASPIEMLAKESNGRAVEASDGNELDAWIDDLAVEIHEQYVMLYTDPNPTDGRELDVQLVTNDAHRTGASYSNRFTMPHEHWCAGDDRVPPIPFWGRPAIWETHPFWYVSSVTMLLLACVQMVVVISRRRRRPS
jgi:hypothetical protein